MEVSSPATPTVDGERSDLKPLFDFNQYRLKVPLQEVPFGALDNDKPECLICGFRFNPNPSLCWNATGQHPRRWYGLCNRHYISAFYAADPTGRLLAEAEILAKVPQPYRAAEFNTFRATGACAGLLREARAAVASWTHAVVAGWGRTLGSGAAGSLYVYGCKTASGTGNGCGKTHLAYASFKHIARLTAIANASHITSDPTLKPILSCAFIDVQEIVSEFLSKRDKNDGSTVWYNFDNWGGVRQSKTFDEYLAHLAAAPVLFVDDIGHGSYSDKNGNPNFASRTFETIADARALNALPTLYTSNYAPDALGDVIGTRAASRIFRSDCKLVQVQAPDYALAQIKAREAGGQS